MKAWPWCCGLRRDGCWTVALSVAVLLFGSGVGRADNQPPAVEPIDTAALNARFADRLGDMLQAGQAVDVKRLQSQLTEDRSAAVDVKSPSAESLDPPRLYATCCPGVVIVGKIAKCDKCDDWHASMASGFVIHADGLVVTNHHVVEDTRGAAIGVRTWDDRLLAVKEVVAVDRANDLAVLRVDGDGLTPLAIARDAPVGTPVFVISHPVNQFYTMTDGIVAGQFLRRNKTGDTTRQEMAITADFAKGASGAPVLDATGAVVGVVQKTTPVYYERTDGVDSKIQMVWKYCVPSSALLKLVEQADVVPGD